MKATVKSVAEKLAGMAEEVKSRTAYNIACATLASIERSAFHVAVLGEFKRGKSSMINSLLGEEILPADILPATATINVVQYGTDNMCTVIYENGEKERYPLEKECLSRLCVDGDVDATTVRHVLIEINNELLKKQIVFIDTPGVNDISQSRIEVTHNILPHCDAALFLLDAVAPLTQSEADFITTKVLNSSLTSLLFIISKSDRLDDDELCESIAGAEERLNVVIGKPVKVIPYSAREQMNAYRANRNTPQCTTLLAELELLRQKADEQKYERIADRLKLAAELILSEISVIEAFNQATQEQIASYQRGVDDGRLRQEALFNQLMTNSEKVGRQTLAQLFSKACDYLAKTMISELEYQIRLAEGDVEKMWNRQIPIQIERRIKLFAEEKGQEMQQFLLNYTNHLTSEYQRLFDIPLQMELKEQGINLPVWQGAAQDDDDNQAARIIKDVMPFTLGMVLGNIMLPGIGTIIGGAVGSVLSKTINSSRAAQLKEELLVQLPTMIDAIIISYKKETLANMDKWFDDVHATLENHHKMQREQIVMRIESAIARPDEQKQELDNARLEEIKRFINQLQTGGEI